MPPRKPPRRWSLKPKPRAAPLRDESKQETRAALIRAAAELFAEQGLDVPSLDAVCSRAGFTRGAFYVHFTDREDLIAAVMESATRGFVDALLSSEGHAAGLGEIVAGFADSVAGGTFPVFGEVPVHQFLAACARSTRVRERYLEVVLAVRNRLADATRADQRAGVLRADVDPELAGGLLLALALGVGTLTQLAVPFDPSAHAGTLLQLILPGRTAGQTARDEKSPTE